MRTDAEMQEEARRAVLADLKIATDLLVSNPERFEDRVRVMIGPDSIGMDYAVIAAHCVKKCEKMLGLAKRGHWSFSTTEFLGWLALRDAANLRLARSAQERVRHAG